MFACMARMRSERLRTVTCSPATPFNRGHKTQLTSVLDALQDLVHTAQRVAAHCPRCMGSPPPEGRMQHLPLDLMAAQRVMGRTTLCMDQQEDTHGHSAGKVLAPHPVWGLLPL